MASNAVTLTFIANTASMDRGFKDVVVGADNAEKSFGGAGSAAKVMGEKFELAGRGGRGLSETFRGLSDATLLAGGSLGTFGMDAILVAGSVQGLGKGLGRLTELVKGTTAATALLRVTGIGAGVGLGLLGLHMEGSLASASTYKKGLADLNLALATNIHFVTQGIPGISTLTGWWRRSADASSIAAHNADANAAALSRMTAQAINAGYAYQFLTNAEVSAERAKQSQFGPYKTGYQFDTQNSGYQDLAYQANMAAPKSSGGGGGGGVSAAAKAATAAADALKQKLSTFQQIADQYSQIGKSIADSLGPKLVAGVAGYVVQGGGTTLLGNLKKQLADTIHLKKDLAALAKGGLDASLLTVLTNGGLGSLGAADELLAGGKSGISTASSLARQINSAGGSIAGSEAAREIKNQDKTINVNVNVKGAQKEFEVLLAKLFATKGAKSFGLKAA